MATLHDFPIEYAYSIGKNVFFRYLTEEDAIGDWHHWFNSPEIVANLSAQAWLNTPESQIEYLHSTRNTKERLVLGVCDLKTAKLIGVGGLSKIDYINRRAEMSIVIGSAAHRKGVYAMDAMSMLTEIGFVRLNLHKIVATALAPSIAGIEMTKLLGYRECGRLTDHAFCKGKWEDCILMEILQSDWLNSVRRQAGE